MTRTKHSSTNPDAPTASAPDQWVPDATTGPAPSGDGPVQYVEGE